MGSIIAAKLPQELIDEVIGHLRDNKDWLSSCCLVNRAWSPFARMLLFRSVYVSPAKLPMTPHEGYPSIEVPDWSAVPRLLGNMPRLTIWATELHIKGTSTPTRRTIANSSDESSDASDDERYWQSPNDRWCYIFPSVDTLFAVSQVLPRLQHIYLRDIAVMPGTRHPRHPTPLDTLTLSNVGVMLQGNVLWELFRLFSPRQSVILDVFWRPTMDRTVQQPPSAPSPTSFVAHTWRLRGRPSVEYILAHLASTSFIHHAKSLDIALSDEIELQALMQLMRKSASTLTQLKIDMREAFFTFDQDVLMISDIGDVWDEEVDFAVCPSLESLELGVLMGTTPRSAETLHDISRALSTLPPSVNRLRLIVDFPFFGPDLMGLPWIELNMLSSLPNLHTVEFIILKEGGLHPIDLDVQNDLLSFFPDRIQSLSNVLRLRFAE